MRGALGLKVNLVQLVDTGQNFGAALQGDHKHIAGSQTAIDGAGEDPWDVAKGINTVVGVHQAPLVVLVKVHGGGRGSFFATVRVQSVMVSDGKEIPEEISHGCADRMTIGTVEEEMHKRLKLVIIAEQQLREGDVVINLTS